MDHSHALHSSKVNSMGSKDGAHFRVGQQDTCLLWIRRFLAPCSQLARSWECTWCFQVRGGGAAWEGGRVDGPPENVRALVPEISAWPCSASTCSCRECQPQEHPLPAPPQQLGQLTDPKDPRHGGEEHRPPIPNSWGTHSQQDQLPNLWGPVQNENVGP